MSPYSIRAVCDILCTEPPQTVALFPSPPTRHDVAMIMIQLLLMPSHLSHTHTHHICWATISLTPSSLRPPQGFRRGYAKPPPPALALSDTMRTAGIPVQQPGNEGLPVMLPAKHLRQGTFHAPPSSLARWLLLRLEWKAST